MSKVWYEEEVGASIIKKKYLHEGEVHYNDMVCRITSCFDIDLRDKLAQALYSADFFPAGRSLYALGCKGKFSATTSNCYTLPSPEDNLPSIYDVGKEMAIISSRGGGVGINMSNLRPRGAKVKNTAKTSTGAVSFTELYNTTGGLISQNGRRGALLLGLNCNHPDLEEFLALKQNDTATQSANISILFDDLFLGCAFKEPYADGSPIYRLNFTVKSSGEYITKDIDAGDFFRRFCEVNKVWAEPGAIFIDRVREWHLLSQDPNYKIDICNPCGEYFASAYNACNLGSINVYNFIKDKFSDHADVEWNRLQESVILAVNVLDETLTYGEELQPLEENKQNIRDYRAIGLGVFGLADALIALSLKYGDKEATAKAQDIMRFIFISALSASNKLAKEKGAFEKCNPETLLNSPVLDFLTNACPELEAEIMKYGLRNASLISIAPTGTIATMCGMSGGIEPLYQIAYRRTTHSLVKEGKYFDVYAKSVRDLMEHYHWSPEEYTVEQIKAKFPFVVDSHDIDPINRVKFQGAIQEYVDNAISSTVNMKKESTVKDIMKVYKTAWEVGCKGITIFVDGCKRTAIMGEPEKPPTPFEVASQEQIVKALSTGEIGFMDSTVFREYREPSFDSIVPIKIGDVDCKKIVKRTSCVDKMNVFVCNKDGNIVEVFTSIVAGCTSNIATITRLASALFRAKVAVPYILKQLRKTRCQGCIKGRENDPTLAFSCGSAIADAVEEEYLRIKTLKKESIEITDDSLMPCPECGEKTMKPEGRCNVCTSCGYSKCD